MRGAIVDIGPESRKAIIRYLKWAARTNPEGDVRITLTSSETTLKALDLPPLELKVDGRRP